MSDSRYRLTERIAAGGMAEVFKGVAESLQGFRKNVAIKRILPNLTKNQKFVTMFLDEARLSLFLQHANIVQVFDIGHTDETYFIVMEFVDGVDLKAIFEWRRRIRKRLTIGQCIYMIMEVCKGLAYAHDLPHPETGRPLGIVHRDISPANVLISRNGEIKLADFGLAKAASQVEATDPGVVKGKMSYLSPEAARGENVDHRADIFAVGILLYEALTSKRLFYGESDYQTVEMVRNAKIPSISQQNPEVEPEFEEIVRKALARRVEDRFQTATDLQDALAHYWFSRGLKMIQRDISDLVRACQEEQATLSAGGRAKKPNLIDTILHEQLDAFTSVGFDGSTPGPEAARITENQSMHRPTGGFIDPRAWSQETDWPARHTGAQPVLKQPPRDTRADMAARHSAGMATPPAPARSTMRTAANQPGTGSLPVMSKPGTGPNPTIPAPIPTPEAAIPAPVAPQGLVQGLAARVSKPGKGMLIGVMLAALAAGALLAWMLVGR
jgi:eukaryotic-like serine/threonine-protein kinase